MAGFFNISLIHWTRNSEHDNFAPSVAGIPPDLNTDLTLIPKKGKRNPEPGEKNNSRSILWKPLNSGNKLIILIDSIT